MKWFLLALEGAIVLGNAQTHVQIAYIGPLNCCGYKSSNQDKLQGVESSNLSQIWIILHSSYSVYYSHLKDVSNTFYL